MNPIPEFTETELWTVRTALSERYGKSIELRLTDSELRLNLESTTLTPCPTIFWAEGGVNFIIFKVGESEYRSQFFTATANNSAPGATITTTWPNVSPFCCRYRRTTNAAVISRPTHADYSYSISTP